MNTSSKYRRLIRKRKLRRQRTKALAVITVIIAIITNVAFSENIQKNGEHDVVAVVVSQGDTVWSIAKEYKPKGANLNEFVYEISANNGVKDGNIYCGQTLYIPVES